MTARPCRGPHRCPKHAKAADPACDACPPLTSAPLCDACKRDLVKLIRRIPDAYLDAYMALEPGQRYDVRQEKTHGGKRSKGSHAPLPLDTEADALMGRILEVVLSWHDAVVAGAGLSGTAGAARIPRQRVTSHYEPVVEATMLPRLEDETERGEFVAVRPVQRVEAVGQDSTAGVALTTACCTLAVHVDVLLTLPATPVNRVVPHTRVLARKTTRRFAGRANGPPDVQHLGRPLLDDDTIGRVLADGRAIVVRELDGVDAALELFALGRDVRRTLGQSRGATVFDRPCPGCDEPGLVLLQGEDVVRCSACGEEWGASDWQRLEMVLKSSPKTEVS